MPKILIIFLVSLTFFVNIAEASKRYIASVEKVRGIATKLLPGSLEASKVEVGDQLPEDTSIVTAKSSFVKLKFIDLSEVSLGPESKLLVSEMKEGEAGIITLLKGRIRTEVQKSTKNANQTKLFIRTRTAALGIRGTDFQTIYNPENRMTSLLTFKGEVAMAKISEMMHRKFEEREKIEVSRKDKNEIEIIKNEAPVLDEKKELSKLLKSRAAVLVAPGQNSFSSDSLIKSSLPVKISPTQFNILFKNTEFNVKELQNLNASSDLKESEKKLSVVEQMAPLEGFLDSKNGDFAPKAGGFIDLNSGIYIAPDENAIFNENEKVYMANNVGDVDVDTGQYMPPKGLSLDAKNGFIVNKGYESKPEILALRDDLNRTISKDFVLGDIENEVELANRASSERFIRNSLSFKFSANHERVELNKNLNGRPHFEFDSNLAKGLNIEFSPSTTNQFVPIIGLEMENVKFKELGRYNFSQDSGTVYKMFFGMKYALAHRLELTAKMALDQSHYADLLSVGPEIYRFRRITVSKFHFKLDYEIIRSKKWQLNTLLESELGFRKRFNQLVLDEIKGLNFGIQSTYKLAPTLNLTSHLNYKYENSEMRNLAFQIGQRRETVSLAMGLERLF